VVLSLRNKLYSQQQDTTLVHNAVVDLIHVNPITTPLTRKHKMPSQQEQSTTEIQPTTAIGDVLPDGSKVIGKGPAPHGLKYTAGTYFLIKLPNGETKWIKEQNTKNQS
jgi:hypothetical protein